MSFGEPSQNEAHVCTVDEMCQNIPGRNSAAKIHSFLEKQTQSQSDITSETRAFQTSFVSLWNLKEGRPLFILPVVNVILYYAKQSSLILSCMKNFKSMFTNTTAPNMTSSTFPLSSNDFQGYSTVLLPETHVPSTTSASK